MSGETAEPKEASGTEPEADPLANALAAERERRAAKAQVGFNQFGV